MGSFRNRLLAVIIGLVCVTQTVTLIAVLARTAHSVGERAAKQLVAGSSFVEQLVRFRAAQLASGVAVLAADFGFREAVASGDGPTMLSAAQNDVQRIGADLMVLIDTHGHVLASTERVPDSALQRLLTAADMSSESPHVMVLGGRAYQFFLAPVLAPEAIGWVAMGFAVDDTLARRMSELAGAPISLVTRDPAGATYIASTLPDLARAALLAMHSGGSAPQHKAAWRLHLGSEEYLTVTRRIATSPDTVDVWVHQPMHEVLAPYRDLRDAMLLIGTVALLLAAGIGMLAGRSASRPIAELVRAARRIEEGRYGKPVVPRGAEDFRRLAATFNTMQEGIAEREARITQLAYHDALTGLPNRSFAENHIDQQVRDHASAAFTVILIDLGNLPEINASLGHHVGDDALSEAARRLKQNVAPTDLVARLSAQQFVIVAAPCSLQRAPFLAEQLTGIIGADFRVAEVGLELHPTAGISAFPEHGQSARELLRCAQMALHDAQDARLRVALYRAGRDEQHRRRLALVTELRRALEQEGLKLVYQPKVEMATRTVTSVEALARWTHHTLGIVSPVEFVPLAEQTGNTRRLTSWVIGEAIRQMAEWRALGLDIDVAVNLSASDILDAQLGDEVLRCLERHGIAPTRLLLEITESAVMRDPVLAARHMQLLRVAGVRFAMDDFGTGYSSLSQLSRLPVDELKIDRSLIAHAYARPDDAMIVTSTIELAHGMGLKVVAEGVEDIEAWNFLRRLGCDLAQGFLISKPLPPQEVMAFISRANRLLQDSDSTQLQMRALEQLAATGR